MKNRKTMVITCALAAVMIAGSAVTAFAAESVSVPEEGSAGVSQTQELPETSGEQSDSRQKPEKKVKKAAYGEENSTDSEIPSDSVKRRPKRGFRNAAEAAEDGSAVQPERTKPSAEDGTSEEGAEIVRKHKRGMKGMKSADAQTSDEESQSGTQKQKSGRRNTEKAQPSGEDAQA